jgi:hypothetical protein
VLTSPERADVEDAFAYALSVRDQTRTLIVSIFRTRSDAILLEMPIGSGTAESVARFVVNACLASKWTCSPPLLDMLLEYLVTSLGRGDFAAVRERVLSGVDPNPTEYDATWLFAQRPFFDRTRLRDQVRRLIEENERPILRVSTTEDSFGRTYSRSFLEHLEDRLPGTVHVLAAELSPGTGPSYRIEELLETIGAQLGVLEPVPPRASSDHPKAAARWVLRHLMSHPGRWLLVMDGFGQAGLLAEVRETIESLAAMVPTGQYRRRIRLVLLDYPHQLPGTPQADLLEETITPAAQVGVEDIRLCLAAWNADRRAEGREAFDDDGLLTFATELLNAAPESGRGRLEKLNASLVSLTALPKPE